MKKANPETGLPYRRGDFNPSKTHQFWGYKTGHINKDGFFSMNWKTPKDFKFSLQKQKNKQRDSNRVNVAAAYPKRLNPKTQMLFELGDIREDGYVFCGYNSNGKVKGGFRGESWLSPEAYLKYRVGNSLNKAKKRAAENGLEFNLTVEKMYQSLPAEMICPILGIKMYFGGDRDDSPSLDRLIPEKGYVIGNVQWVSKLANTIKSDHTPNELRRIADWIENQPIFLTHSPNDTNDKNDN